MIGLLYSYLGGRDRNQIIFSIAEILVDGHRLKSEDLLPSTSMQSSVTGIQCAINRYEIDRSIDRLRLRCSFHAVKLNEHGSSLVKMD
jgi:hypothetical protein